MTKTKGSKGLARFRAIHDISQRAAARALKVSHVVLRSWEAGNTRPDEPRRQAILVWTDGFIPLEDWRTADEQKALDAVKTFTAPSAA